MSSSSMSPKTHGDQDKRLRREIANSNERRRMQSINAGFESLKIIIPHHDGEKLSKAAILMQTTEYITNLEQEKTRLLSQNAQLKGMLRDVGRLESSDASSHGSPPPKRKKRDTESSDEGISLSVAGEFDEPTLEELRREMIDLRTQLDRERRLRMLLEEQTRSLESQLYPERLRQINTHVASHIKVAERKRPHQCEDEEEEKMPENCVLPSSNPTVQSGNPLMSSMSRRNLETIVEAIRHLEGDAVLHDPQPDTKDCHIPPPPMSDDGTIEESSDQEDSRSESSGRHSPCPRMQGPVMPMLEQGTPTVLHLKHESRIISANSEKYPIAMQLLHPSSQLPQFIARPGVIVQKS